MHPDQKSPDPLERRPEARAFKVDDLLAQFRLGQIRIPSFQRAIKWERDDVAKLFDSLYRGYPIGTLLFWETSAEPAEVRFGTVVVEAGARNDALWVVDGQQRLVSLTRVLLAPTSDKDGFALYFDLEKNEFVRPPAGLAEEPSRWLPMTEVLDSERLMQWVFENATDDKKRRERAFAVGRRIRDYEIPAYLVRTDDEGVLREVFGRINSAGKRLDQSEVFDALHGARGHSRPASIPQIADELMPLEFGRIDDKLLFSLMRVLLGEGALEHPANNPLRLSPEEAANAYRRTAEIAARVIHFLKNDADIPHFELLPYKQPFVLLGKFFQQYQEPKPRSRELLVRWVWRGALNGTHKGDTVSTRASLERIIAGNEEESVQRLLKGVATKPTSLPAAADAFNFRTAASKLLTLALLDLRPRDMDTGELIPLSQLTDKDGHEFSIPAISQHGRHELLQSAANRLIHPRRPGGLRQRLMQVSEPAILASHGVPEHAYEALRNGDVPLFLAARAAYLGGRFERFLARHARWDEPDRPSLVALTIDDEEA